MTPQAPPADAQSAISAALGRDNVVYHALAEGRGFRVENPDHALSAEFTRAGVRLRSGAAMLGLRLHSIGYGSGLRAVKAPAPRAEDNRVEYRRGTVTEWYINGPLGLEQGFTLESPPPGRNGGPLTLAIALSGDLTATLDSPGDSITLTNAVDGSAVLRYGGLTASDAAGRRLAARLEIEGREILLSVDDHDARYPIVVDPLVQQARLTASDGVAFGLLGYSIAIDHDTIVVGAPGGVEDAAYLFVKPAAGWSTTSTFTAKLLPSDVLGGDFYGYPVAIRGDTVVVGALYGTPEHDLSLNGSGAVYVFTKPAGGWTSTSDAVKLLPATLQSYSGEPTWNVDSAAVGDDEILIGHRYADEGSGAVSVFSRPPAGWGTAPAPYPLINESARLTLPDGVGGGDFGGSLALSGDTLVVGADLAATDPDNPGVSQGAAFIYSRPAGGWATTSAHAAKLRASDGAAGDNFGFSSAVSGDRVVVGAPGDDVDGRVNQGSVYVYDKPAGGWVSMTETMHLIAGDGAAGDTFGNVSMQGDTIAVGAPTKNIDLNTRQGAAYVLIPGVVTGNCDDGNPCTDDTGDPGSGCVHTNNNAPCDDGSICTISDACSGGACQGVALSCIDDNACTVDFCDEATGCVNLDASADCDDGNICTVDSCDPAVGCMWVDTSAACDDGNACTADACDPATGCVHADSTAACDDGNACTSGDTCNYGVCGRMTGMPAAKTLVTCGIRDDGRLVCWGYDAYGQVSGPNSSADRYTAVTIGDYHVCALRADGRLACWGRNVWGETSEPNASGDSYLAVSASGSQTCALRADQRLVCWGFDGDGSVSGPIASLDSYTSVSINDYFSCGLRVDGRIVCWGMPVAIASANASTDTFTSINAGRQAVCGVRVDGRLRCMGPAGYPPSTGRTPAPTCSSPWRRRTSPPVACGWTVGPSAGAEVICRGRTPALTPTSASFRAMIILAPCAPTGGWSAGGTIPTGRFPARTPARGGSACCKARLSSATITTRAPMTPATSRVVASTRATRRSATTATRARWATSARRVCASVSIAAPGSPARRSTSVTAPGCATARLVIARIQRK